MIFTHPHTEGPGVWGHREEIHNGHRRLARNKCEVEIYAEFAPPGEWTSKLELFLGEGGFLGGCGGFFGFRGSGYTESYLWHLVFTYTIKRWILHLHWWPIDRRTYFTEDHGDIGNRHGDTQELMQALGRAPWKGNGLHFVKIWFQTYWAWFCKVFLSLEEFCFLFSWQKIFKTCSEDIKRTKSLTA